MLFIDNKDFVFCILVRVFTCILICHKTLLFFYLFLLSLTAASCCYSCKEIAQAPVRFGREKQSFNDLYGLFSQVSQQSNLLQLTLAMWLLKMVGQQEQVYINNSAGQSDEMMLGNGT